MQLKQKKRPTKGGAAHVAVLSPPPFEGSSQQSQSSSSADIGQWRHQLSRFHHREWGELLRLIRKVHRVSSNSFMVNFRLLILQKLTRKKTLMARLQEDRDIGTEDLLSSGLIPSCHPSLERTGEDEHMNGGGVHRSTNKTGGRDDKGDSKGSGRHLCYLALSPLESIGLAQGNCVLNSLKQCWPIPVNGPTLLKLHCLAIALKNEA